MVDGCELVLLAEERPGLGGEVAALAVAVGGQEDRCAPGVEPDLGALVRAYWELQRVTGRVDLRDTWRSLADQLWSPEAA